jgi:hypothetical protein
MATTPTILGGTNGFISAGSATITLSISSGVAGDLALMTGYSKGAAMSGPAGWTTGYDTGAQGSLRTTIIYRVLQAGDFFPTTWNFSGPAGSPNWSLLRTVWHNVDISRGIFRPAFNYDSTARAYPTTLDAPSIHGHTTCELVCSYEWRTGPSFSPVGTTGPSGMTAILQNGFNNDTSGNSLLYNDWRLDLSSNAATGTRSLGINATAGASFVEGLGLSYLLVGVGTNFGGWQVGGIRIA